MRIFPAIDLKDGQCVRLKQGLLNEATVFNTDPAQQAHLFEEQGFSALHVVDLNGAFAGRSCNNAAVQAILEATKNPVQLGGGIREMAAIERWLEAGVARVILGTAAVRDPEFVRSACRAWPGRIAVSLDARNGLIAVEGWAETTEIEVQSFARRLADMGVCAFIYTDVERDGLLEGLNILATLGLAHVVDVPVIASGGLSGMKDIARLLEPDCAILEGAIAGRALYDGRLDLEKMQQMIAQAFPLPPKRVENVEGQIH